MTIKEVPVGVVKKFKFDYQPFGHKPMRVEVVGAVVKDYVRKGFQLIDTAGAVYNGAAMSNIECSISRSDPEAANLLRNAITLYADYMGCCEQLDELRRQQYTKQDAYRNALRALENNNSFRKSGVALSEVDAAANSFIAKLGDKPKCFGNSVEGEYYTLDGVNYDSKTGTTLVTFDMLLNIQKYASPRSYPFICQEYDGTLYVSRDATLQKFLSQFTQNYLLRLYTGFEHAPFISELSDLSASIGDKNWLCVTQSLTVTLNIPEGYRAFLNFCKNFK